LTDFPLETDSEEVARQKQARLTGNTPPAPQQAISDEPPPKVVNKQLAGRIRPEWKGQQQMKKRYVDFNVTLKEGR
jgi:hypothetical protein